MGKEWRNWIVTVLQSIATNGENKRGLAFYGTGSGQSRDESNAAFRAHHTGHHNVSDAKVTNVDFMTLNYGLTSLCNFYSAKVQ